MRITLCYRVNGDGGGGDGYAFGDGVICIVLIQNVCCEEVLIVVGHSLKKEDATISTKTTSFSFSFTVFIAATFSLSSNADNVGILAAVDGAASADR